MSIGISYETPPCMVIICKYALCPITTKIVAINLSQSYTSVLCPPPPPSHFSALCSFLISVYNFFCLMLFPPDLYRFFLTKKLQILSSNAIVIKKYIKPYEKSVLIFSCSSICPGLHNTPPI